MEEVFENKKGLHSGGLLKVQIQPANFNDALRSELEFSADFE
jgi:hypothetical protein